MTASAKKSLTLALKATLLILAFTFIYKQYLKKGDNIKQFELAINRLDHTHVALVLSAVFMLMLANWLVECFKWQYLTRHLTPVSLWQAVEGVFCGLTWAVFTPNRIGEYGGRVMFLPPRKRIHGVFAMAVGSFGQNVITNVLGAASAAWFCFTFLKLNTWALGGIAVLAVLIIALFIVLFFNIKWLVWLLSRIPFLHKYHRFFDVMASYKFTELAKIISFCLARFAIFSSQYYLLIHLFIPELAVQHMMPLVFIVFFVQSALPSLDLLDVSVRATTATAVFDYVTNQQIAIIATFSAVWLINLIVPAILGSVFIFKLKFFERSN